MATHITLGKKPHRLELKEQRGTIGIFDDLDCLYPSRLTCAMSCVTPTFEALKEWRKENG